MDASKENATRALEIVHTLTAGECSQSEAEDMTRWLEDFLYDCVKRLPSQEAIARNKQRWARTGNQDV